MVYKKSWILILFISSNIFLTQVAISATGLTGSRWKMPDIDKNHGPFYTDSLLGLIIQDGNTIDNTVAFKSDNSLVLDREILLIGGHYNYGWDENGLSSRNWDLRLRYDYKLKEKLHPFASLVIEGDPFAGFNNRNNYDLGVNFPLKSASINWTLELGYRYTRESPTADPIRYQNKIRLHAAGLLKLASNSEIELWLRYLPFLSDTQGDLPNYMFDWGISVKSHFTQAFYLNLNFTRNYRQVPLEGRKQLDSKLIGSVGYKI